MLAYGIKYFYQSIVEDFDAFYSMYRNQLFCHKNKHIRKFSAESFSYILRKLSKQQRDAALLAILKSLLADGSRD